MEFGFHLNSTSNTTLLYCELNPEDPFCWQPLVFPPFKLTPAKIVSAIGMGLLIIIALGGNVLVCTAFCFYRRLRKTTNYFIISLAVSDILVATIAMPIWLSYEVTEWRNLPSWIEFTMLERFWRWFDVLAGVSSITNLTAISIDRCFSIMCPLLHRTRMTGRIVIIMVMAAWLYSIILASLGLSEHKYYTAIVSAGGFFLPLLIILIAYVTIYIKVKSGGYSPNSEKDWNLERTLIIVISVFTICWLPFFIISLLYHYCLSCHFDQNMLRYLLSIMKWMHYLNSCCNPFIYGLFNMNFKYAFRALLKNWCTTSGQDADWTNAATEGHETSLKQQIKNLKKKLQSNRKERGNTLLSDVETASVCLTILPTSASNRNSNTPSTIPGDLVDALSDEGPNLIGNINSNRNLIEAQKNARMDLERCGNNNDEQDALLPNNSPGNSSADPFEHAGFENILNNTFLEDPAFVKSVVDSHRINILQSQESCV